MVGQLDGVNEEIHDRWFSLHDIEHDGVACIWRVWFAQGGTVDRRRATTARGVPGAKVLEIVGVESYEMTDSEHVLWYDFDKLRYDARNRQLCVLTNIPLVLRLLVSNPQIRIMEAGRDCP